MLYWKYSSNRIFFLNEYWILIPVMASVNYLIIRKIRSNKEKIELLERLKEQIKRLEEQIERQQKLRRIFILSLGLNGYAAYLFMRGGDGSNYVNTDYINCIAEEGLRYLDNERLRKIIHDLFNHKRIRRGKGKGKVIYITATAVCHLADLYGRYGVAFPVAVGDFGITNLYHTVRKVLVTIFLGGIVPLWYMGGPGAFTGAIVLATSGLRLAFVDLDYIPTSPVSETGSVNDVGPRIPNSPDVVVVSKRKDIMPDWLKQKKECWLPDQALLNPTCQVKTPEIPDAIDLVSHDLNYNDVVSMKDVTRLHRADFSDVLDLGSYKIPEN